MRYYLGGVCSVSIVHAHPCDCHLVSVTELCLGCSSNMIEEVWTECRASTQFVAIGAVTVIPYAQESIMFYRNSHIFAQNW